MVPPFPFQCGTPHLRKVHTMKKALLAALVLALAPVASHAATLNFPSEAPVASVTIPDEWKPEETESGIQAQSPDDAVYLSMDVADGDNVEKVIGDTFKYLEDQKVTVDPATQKETDATVNGMVVKNFEWSGKDQTGDASIAVALVQVSAENMLVLTYWGTPGDQDKHGDTIAAILSSMKPAE